MNFIIYVIFGEKFKRLFLKLFCSHGFFGHGGRDSPDGGTHDDSFMSYADRQSVRLQRSNTAASRNGVGTRLNGSAPNGKDSKRSVRIRSPSPGPCVYYPALRNVSGKEISDVQTTQTTVINEWEQENGMNTSGF